MIFRLAIAWRGELLLLAPAVLEALLLEGRADPDLELAPPFSLAGGRAPLQNPQSQALYLNDFFYYYYFLSFKLNSGLFIYTRSSISLYLSA